MEEGSRGLLLNLQKTKAVDPGADIITGLRVLVTPHAGPHLAGLVGGNELVTWVLLVRAASEKDEAGRLPLARAWISPNGRTAATGSQAAA